MMNITTGNPKEIYDHVISNDVYLDYVHKIVSEVYIDGEIGDRSNIL